MLLRLIPIVVFSGCSSNEGETSSLTNETNTTVGTETQDTQTATTPIDSWLQLNGERPENLVLLTIDTLRRDYIGAYAAADGTDQRQTPNLDRFFEQGIAFGEHYTCSSWTYPSGVCALTGRSQYDLKFWPEKGDTLPPAIGDDAVLLSEILQEAGLYTILQGGSGFFGFSTNMDQGFDVGESFFYEESAAYPDPDYLFNDEVIAAAKADILARPAGQPFYLHMHLQQVHAPFMADDVYLTPTGFYEHPKCLDPNTGAAIDFNSTTGHVELWKLAAEMTEDNLRNCIELQKMMYEACTHQTDAQIGEFMEWLDEQELTKSTAVMHFSDHGEEFHEHGHFDHGKSAFEELIRVGAAIWFTGSNWSDSESIPVLKPAWIDSKTTHEDLVPSVLSVMGINSDEPFTGSVPIKGKGRDVVHNLTTMSPLDGNVLPRTRQAVMDGRYKLAVRWDCESDDLIPQVDGQGPWWFYDLDQDPGEDHNLFGDPAYQEIAESLWAELEPRIELVAADPAYEFGCDFIW